MHIAILTFEGYNELDSLIALGVLNRIKSPGWRVSIASPTPTVRSMNGVVIESMADLDEACAADAVIVGSGSRTREVVEDRSIMGTWAGWTRPGSCSPRSARARWCWPGSGCWTTSPPAPT